MTLTATLASASADTYATLPEYQAYILATYNVTLSGADEAQRANLREAARHIDKGYLWHGEKTTREQARAWPRYTSILVDGWAVLSTSVPQDVIDAQCEMAYRISLGATPSDNIEGGAVKREKVDVIETEYMDGTGRDRAAYPAVDALLAPYHKGKTFGRAGSVPLVRA